MGTPKRSLRRSVVIPVAVAEEAAKYAPKEVKGNFNRLVVTALEEYAEKRRSEEVAEDLAAMAADRQMRRECDKIAREFAEAEADGMEKRP